jgi:hypothetical protein
MKYFILLFLLFSGMATSYGQNIFGLIKNPDKYEHIFTYFFVRPVNLDTSKVDNHKTYLLEGFKRKNSQSDELVPILVFIKGEKLKELLSLHWPTSLNPLEQFPGKGFTANFLGKKSILSRKDLMDSTKFDQQQLETLKRDKNIEKYELRSTLPVNVCGSIKKDVFILTTCSY